MAQAEVGASRIVRILAHNIDQPIYHPTGVIVRVWGFLLLLFVAVLQILKALGGDPPMIGVWLTAYLIYVLFLELMRWQARRTHGRIAQYYESQWFRGIRILVNLTLITWLVAISPGARSFSWFFYSLPIFAAVLYFVHPIWTAVAFVASAAGLCIGGIWLARISPLTWGEYFAIVMILAVLGGALWWLFQRALLEPSHLADIAKSLHQTLDLEALVREIMGVSAHLASADRSLVVIVDPQYHRYVTHASQGFDLREGHSIEEVAATCYVLQTGHSFETNDIVAKFKNESLYAKFFNCRPRSILAEPILSRDGRVLGVLTVTHDSPCQFDFLIRDRIRRLSSQVGSAVENCLRHRQARLSGAKNWEVSKKLAMTNNEEELANLLVSEIRELIAVTDGSVLHRFDPKEETLHPWTASHIDPAALGRSIMSIGVGLAGHALDIAEPILVSDVTKHPWFVKTAQVTEFASLIVAPLIAPDKKDMFGTLSVISKKTGAFGLEDEIMMAALANQAAATLAKIRSFAAWKAHGGLMKRIVDEVQRFDTELDEDKLCEQIAQSARKVLGFAMTRVRLLDPQTGDLVTTATAGIPDEDAVALKGHRASSRTMGLLLTQEFRIERSYFVPHGHDIWKSIPPDCFYWPASCEEHKGWHVDDALLTPLIGPSDQMIGLLTVDMPETGMLPASQTIEAIGVYAAAAAWAIDRARAHQRFMEQQRRIETFIGSISDELARTRDVKAVGEVAVQAGAKLLSAEGCSLYLVREKEREIELTNSTYLAGTSYIGRRKPIQNARRCGLAAWAAATGEIACLNQRTYELHPAWSGEIEQLQYMPSGSCNSLLVVPIRTRDDHAILGVLSLENKIGHDNQEDFDQHDVRTVKYLAQQVALALEAIGRYETIEKWERKGLEDDLHELINWYHSGVVLLIDSLSNWLECNDLDKAKKLIPGILHNAYTTVHELKTIHTAVMSEYLETEDLQHALLGITSAWCKRLDYVKTDLSIEVGCPENIKLPAQLRGTLLRIASGAVANAIMHSGVLQDPSIHVRVEVESIDNRVILRVIDNGKGQIPLVEGYGIGRMRQLVHQLDQETGFKPELTIGSSPEAGITVTFQSYFEDHVG